MCKLLIISGMDPKRKKINMEFIKQMGELMSENNKDGLGYTAIDKSGNMFGERWWVNWQAFDSRVEYTQPKKREHSKYTAVKEMVKGFVDLEDEPEDVAFEKYNSFGKRTDEMVAITLHTRMATTEKTFQNVHPFVDYASETSVVHNGIINNVSKEDNIRSTCDSERILNKYLQHEVATVPTDIQNMVDELKGYYACGIFSKDNTGRRVLDVFNSRARLAAAFIKEMNALVFSTDLDDIREVVSNMGLTIVFKQRAVKQDTLVRFDPMTGKVLFTQGYTDNSDVYQHNRHTGRSSSRYESQYDAEWQALIDERDAAANASKLLQFTGTTSRSEADVLASQEAASTVSSTIDKATKEQVQEIIKNASTVDAIIDRNSSDKLNEKLALIDGYQLNDTKDMWIKKSGKMN